MTDTKKGMRREKIDSLMFGDYWYVADWEKAYRFDEVALKLMGMNCFVYRMDTNKGASFILPGTPTVKRQWFELVDELWDVGMSPIDDETMAYLIKQLESDNISFDVTSEFAEQMKEQEEEEDGKNVIHAKMGNKSPFEGEEEEGD